MTGAETRRPKRKSFMADTKTGARRRVDEWKRKNGETVAANSTVTVAKVVGDFVSRFEQSVVSGERAYNTLEVYRLVLKKIEADMIGELPVSKLTTAHVERMMTRMLTGTRHRAKMSTSYVRLVRSVLSRSMPAAIKAGYLVSNPVTGSRPIKPTAKPQRALSNAEVNRVFDAAWAYDPQIFTLISLLVGTGVRRGEALGLQWSDLDPDKPRASIVRQVKRNKGKEVAVKVIAGVRVVPLPESRKVVPHDGAFRGDTHVTRRVHGLDAARPILDAMAQPVIVTDLETTILYWNPAATDLYGFTASEALGQPVHSLLGTPSDLPVVKGADAQTGRGRSWTGELEARTRSGKPLTVLVTLTPLGTQDGAPVALIATAVDVTVAVEDRHRLTEALVLVEEKSGELRHQALHDFLTGLPNRALVLDRAEQMLSRARRQDVPVAALFLDVDSFKDINDSLGHAAGDQLLKEVAARLSGALRDADTIGRLGGDEFVVLVEGTSLDAGAAVVAERLLEVLGEPFILHGSEGSPTPYAVTASIGIAEGDRPQVEDLFRDADMALYRAKAAGRNCYMFFAPEMHAAVRDRLVLEADLRAALDCGQFFLEYQPAFGLADLTTVGIEALLRWRHPARGVVAPLEFISRLEETGLILPAGRWILGEACRQCAEWHHDGLPLAVSVNISGRQLESGSFLTDVIDALSTSGLAPGALVLEFTENVLMGDAEATIGRLEALKAIGVRIAIDNFGTGYPSLAYLRRFPVDILKIDRSFISAMSDSGEGEALLHTLVQLGKQLGLETVAEGIETEDQLYRLQLQDCDTGQGFLVAKPMSASAIKEFVRSSLPQKAAVPALLL